MLKIINKNNEELNSNCSILSIDHQLGLVLESRSGLGRNPDYNIALELLLERLKNANVKSVRVKIVSEDLLKHFHNQLDRTIEIGGTTNLSLDIKDHIGLRKSIGSAMSRIKVNPNSKGGNPTKRIQLISDGLGKKEWKLLILGRTFTGNKTYGEIFNLLEFEKKVEQLMKKSINILPKGNKIPRKIKNASPETFERDPEVKAWVLKKAKGKCENCTQNSPFTKINGDPYLEVHHLKQLSNKGTDTIQNVVALCPNCHKEFHFGINRDKLLKKIYSKVSRLIKE